MEREERLMKKKALIGCGIGLLVVIAVVLVFVLGGKKVDGGKDDDKVVSTVTLDINPSIELGLNAKRKVLEAKALNDDAEVILPKDLKGKSWDDAIGKITDKLIEHGYAKEENVVILMNVTGEAKSEELENGIRHVFGEKKLNSDVIVIDNITDEDKELAKQYNISPAKAAYINTVTKENDKITFEQLVEKPVKELKETKETGKYCDEGWNLEGDFCVREVKRVDAEKSSVCPQDTVEIKGICYVTGPVVDELSCTDGYELRNEKCVGTDRVNAKAKCSTGTYNSKTDKCELATFVSEGTKSCNNEEDLLLDSGKCAAAHPGAHTYGDNDSPFDEATECCCGDTFRNGWCYSLPNGNYDAKITCPSGSTSMTGDKGAACYSVSSSAATYTCDKGKLDGNKCIVDVTKNPERKPTCENDLTLYEERVCYNKNETKPKEEGYHCKNKDARLEGEQCAIMEIVDAKQ